jgi:hypothetical protein
MKECVIITSQEEWDFVSEKLGYKWKNSNLFEEAFKECQDLRESLCINLIDCAWSEITYYFKNEYIIHTFNEWLAINNLQYNNNINLENDVDYMNFLTNFLKKLNIK